MIMPKHGFTRWINVEGLVQDVKQDHVTFPDDDLIDEDGYSKVHSPVRKYYIKPEGSDKK